MILRLGQNTQGFQDSGKTVGRAERWACSGRERVDPTAVRGTLWWRGGIRFRVNVPDRLSSLTGEPSNLVPTYLQYHLQSDLQSCMQSIFHLCLESSQYYLQYYFCYFVAILVAILLAIVFAIPFVSNLQSDSRLHFHSYL